MHKKTNGITLTLKKILCVALIPIMLTPFNTSCKSEPEELPFDANAPSSFAAIEDNDEELPF